MKTFRQASGLISVMILLTFYGCRPSETKPAEAKEENHIPSQTIPNDVMHLMVLGIAQDAGYPQADCKKSCCIELWSDKSRRKMVSSLGVRDPSTGETYLFDATPDIRDQLQLLKYKDEKAYNLSGIFLTHAHIGHYTGLMHLGREAMGAKAVPVYAMPRMSAYLRDNGPWSLLHSNHNIDLKTIKDCEPIELSKDLTVTPLLVPHRDEYSETVGYLISGAKKKVLFIPDIDKWSKWDADINEWISRVDYAFLDGTFYRNGEIWGRDMSQIPHPFIEESIDRFSSLSEADKQKVYFIHLNHTNPLLNTESEEYNDFQKLGFNIAEELQEINI